MGLSAFRSWVAGVHFYDTCAICPLWKPSSAALPLRSRSARDTHSLPLLVCPAQLIEDFEEFLLGSSYVWVRTFSGLGKGRMILLGQSPSPEKTQYGWRF